MALGRNSAFFRLLLSEAVCSRRGAACVGGYRPKTPFFDKLKTQLLPGLMRTELPATSDSASARGCKQ